jgi:hypothetical protein
VLLLLSVLVYPSLAGNNTPSGGGRPVTAPTSDRGLQYLGQQEAVGAGTEWPTGPTNAVTLPSVATADPTSTVSTASTDDPGSPTAPDDPGTTSAAAGSSSPRGSTSSSAETPATSATPRTGTTPPGSSSTPSGTSSADNPRAVAQALFPEFGFPANEFGCLNAAWNRLGLWSTAAAVRPGLIYVKGRYGTPCAAWDHVRTTGNY